MYFYLEMNVLLRCGVGPNRICGKGEAITGGTSEIETNLTMIATGKMRVGLRQEQRRVEDSGPRRIRSLRVVCCMSVLLLFLTVGSGVAQNATQLTINIDVQSSIQMVFQNNPNVGQVGFCALANPNTNSVGLNLGAAWMQGQNPSPCSSFTLVNSSLAQIGSAFDIVVTKMNTSSPNYRLAAQISSPPPYGIAWLVNGVTLNSTSLTTLDTADNYATPITKAIQVQLGWVGQQTLQETVTFLATAN